MVILVDAEKVFDNIQHLLMTSVGETRTKGNAFQYNKGYIQQASSSHHTKRKNT